LAKVPASGEVKFFRAANNLMFSFKLDALIINHNGDDLIDVAYDGGHLSNFTTGKIWQKSLENMTSLPPNGSFESQRAFRDLSTALTVW
jgi:hypothetical protein